MRTLGAAVAGWLAASAAVLVADCPRWPRELLHAAAIVLVFAFPFAAVGGVVFWLFAVKLQPIHAGVTGAVALAAMCGARVIPRVPDLPKADAEAMLAGAPQFGERARLVKFESVAHLKGSMDASSRAEFTMQRLNGEGGLVRGRADYQYVAGQWYLREFDYGCPGSSCQIIHVSGFPD